MSLSKIAEVYEQQVINEGTDLTSGQTAPGKNLSGGKDYIEGDTKEGHGGIDDVKDLKKPETRKEKEESQPKVLKASFDPFNDLYNKIVANEDFGNWEVADENLPSSGDDNEGDVNLSFGGNIDNDGEEEGEESEEGGDQVEAVSGLDAVIQHLQAAVEALQALHGGSEEEEEESEDDLDVDADEEEFPSDSDEEGGEELSKESMDPEDSDSEEDDSEDEVEESCETTIIGHALTTGLKKLQAGLNEPRNNKPNFGLPKPAGAAKVAPGTKAHELKVLTKDIGKKAIFNKLQKGQKVDKTAGSDGYDKVGSNFGYGSK